MKFDGPSELTNSIENYLFQGILLPFYLNKCLTLLAEHQVKSQNVKTYGKLYAILGALQIEKQLSAVKVI